MQVIVHREKNRRMTSENQNAIVRWKTDIYVEKDEIKTRLKQVCCVMANDGPETLLLH